VRRDGGGVWLLSPQLPGARTMRANRYRRRGRRSRSGGTQNGIFAGTEALKMIFLPKSLCPDIKCLSAILGQNTKYVF
jgi:hypothetical protein